MYEYLNYDPYEDSHEPEMTCPKCGKEIYCYSSSVEYMAFANSGVCVDCENELDQF